jgi:hypothetical protein
MLSNARKRIRATLTVQIVSSAERKNKSKQNKNTYTLWQTNNGINCAVTLKEVVTVRIVVQAHQLDMLL